MDNGAGRHPMAETVYGTEDSTMVMSEKVKFQKSIVVSRFSGRGSEWNHDWEIEKQVEEKSEKIKSMEYRVTGDEITGDSSFTFVLALISKKVCDSLILKNVCSVLF